MRAELTASLLMILAAAACSDEPGVERASATRVFDGSASPFDTAVADTLADTSDTGGPDPDTTDTSGPDGDTTLLPDTVDTPDPVDTNDTVDTSDTTDAVDTSDTVDTTDTTDTGPTLAPDLATPSAIAIPWVAASAGPSNLELAIPNRGGFATIAATVLDSGLVRVTSAPVSVAAGADLVLSLRFDGAASPLVVSARLRIDATPQGVGADTVRYEVPVYAVAGANLPSATWTALSSGSTLYGETATVRLASAPFPDSSGSWTDDSVNLFVPADYLDRGPIHYVVHFHGHGTTLASTLTAHRYREQLWASGVNAVLVTPQGPVNAASGNFGKLMRPGNLGKLLSDVSSILYRDRRVLTPLTGDVTLTEHSGGYQAVALNLDETFDEGLVVSAHLFDGLYGYSSAYEAFARAGGYLRSNHTAGGGTRSNNTALLATLGNIAVPKATMANLRDEVAVIWPTSASHNDATWWDQVFSEALRWGSLSARRGPRIELRSAIAEGGTATIRWLAPDDMWTTGFAVETSSDGETWSKRLSVGPHLSSASFPLANNTGLHVRVRAEVEGLPTGLGVASRSAYVFGGAPILVVDGFDRIFGGSWTDTRHDHAARVARLAEAATASNEAVADGEVELTDFPVVIWILGDESVADKTFTPDEQAKVTAYLDAGGALIVSGSELAYELRSTASSFLSRLGAVYSADDANQNNAKGVGPLAAIPSFAFGTSTAPYLEDFPDVLATSAGSTIILRYGNDMVAGVGRAGSSAVLGFPLETVESDTALAGLLSALVDFVID